MKSFFDFSQTASASASPALVACPPPQGARLTASRSDTLIANTKLSYPLVTDIARDFIETRLPEALEGGLEPVFCKLSLEHFDSDTHVERYEADLKRPHLGPSRFLVTLRFYRGEQLVSTAVLDGALTFADLARASQ